MIAISECAGSKIKLLSTDEDMSTESDILIVIEKVYDILIGLNQKNPQKALLRCCVLFTFYPYATPSEYVVLRKLPVNI